MWADFLLSHSLSDLGLIAEQVFKRGKVIPALPRGADVQFVHLYELRGRREQALPV